MGRRPRRTSSSPRIIGYCRVSTQEQGRSGLSLQAQRSAIQTEAKRRGWADIRIVIDKDYSAKDLRRPGIQEALEALSKGDVDVLMVAKLDRLSRSLLDFALLMERSQREGWSIVALDLGVDTTTPGGEMMANVMASFSQFERRLIGERTSAALQAAKARGQRLGRPRQLSRRIVRRITRERQRGATLAGIADGLNSDGVATAQGGAKWYPATVRAVLQSVELDKETTLGDHG